MNRYQQQAAELDARHHFRVRALTFLGAATIIVIALWAADVRIGSINGAGWWQSVRDWWAQDWFPEKDERHAVPPQLPTPVVADGVSASSGPTKPLPGTDSSLSKVPLPLFLARTEPGRNAQEGKAFMGTSRENPQTYAAGAILVNGARIKEIHSDHVLLERDGKSVKLFVDGTTKDAPTLTLPRFRKGGDQMLNDMLTVGGQPEVKLAVATSHEILTDYIRPSPVYEGDIIKGYQVYAGQKSGVFAQLGLQQGDVITALDNMPFTDPQQAMVMFKQLTEGTALVATVDRKGKRERISLNGALITADQERIKNPPTVPVMPTGPDM